MTTKPKPNIHDTALEYDYTDRKIVMVKLGGKVAGTIRHVISGTAGVDITEGWRYFPKGQRVGGDLFPTLTECQRSLESNDD